MSENAIVSREEKNEIMSADMARAKELAKRLRYMIVNGKNLQDNEVFALAQFAAANDLNPFAGEAYYIPGAGPVPGIAGWRKKAQEQLDFEARACKESGAHFWVEVREATHTEAKFDEARGDIAIHVTLHDWLSNKRWRSGYFDAVRELKDLGYDGNIFEAAKAFSGPEPVWTGVGVVAGSESFGSSEKFDRKERAQKRAEKVAIKKRFPRINLPESDTDETTVYIETKLEENKKVENPQITATQAIANLGYDDEPEAPPEPIDGEFHAYTREDAAADAQKKPDPEQLVNLIETREKNWPAEAPKWMIARDVKNKQGERYVELPSEKLAHVATELEKLISAGVDSKGKQIPDGAMRDYELKLEICKAAMTASQ